MEHSQENAGGPRLPPPTALQQALLEALNEESNDKLRKLPREALRVLLGMSPQQKHRVHAEANRRSAEESRIRKIKEDRDLEADVEFAKESRRKYKVALLKYREVLQLALRNIKENDIQGEELVRNALRDVDETIRQCPLTFGQDETSLFSHERAVPDGNPTASA